MDKLEVMRTVVDDLYATERSIDDAIAQSTDFIATLIQSRFRLLQGHGTLPAGQCSRHRCSSMLGSHRYHFW